MTLHSNMLDPAPAQLLRELTRPFAPEPSARVLVAVSGGSDSVALLHLLAGLAPGRKWAIFVATLDHGLRGEAGEADRLFVERLARDLGLPCASEKRVVQPAPGRSVEDLARSVRREFLLQAAGEFGAAVVALGHSQDDQAETVLYRLGRGAGLAGLSAMRRFAPPLWRPLLGVRRDMLRRLLQDAGCDWREDETNATGGAARSRIRRELTPVLERVLGPGAIPALARFATLAAADEDFLVGAAREKSKSAVLREQPGLIELDSAVLCSLPAALSRRILRECCEALVGSAGRPGSAHILALEALARRDSPGTHADLPGGVSARRKGRILVLQTRDPAAGRP